MHVCWCMYCIFVALKLSTSCVHTATWSLCCLTKPQDFPLCQFPIHSHENRIHTKFFMHSKWKQDRHEQWEQNAYLSLCLPNNNNKTKGILCKCVSKCLSLFDNIFCTISTDCGCLVTVMDSQRYFCYCAVRFPLLLLNLLTHFFYCITWNSILFVLVHFKPQSNLFLSCIRHKIRFVVSFHIVSFSHFYHFGEWCSCPHKCILCILFQIIFVLCFHFLTPFHPTLLPMLLCQVSEPYEYTLLQIVHTRVFFSLLFLSDKVTKPPRLHVHTPYRSKQHFNQFPYSIFRSNEMWMVKSAPASAAAVAYAF